jgi:hypothetical protein
MLRWWFVVLVAGATFAYFTPAAFAGCERGDSATGHNAIAFCSSHSDGRCEGSRSQSRIISGVSGLR